MEDKSQLSQISNQKRPITQVDNQPETSLLSISKQSIIFVIVGALLGFAVFATGGYYLGVNSANKPASNQNNQSLPTPTPIITSQQSPSPSLIPLSYRYLSSSSKIYENQRLSYIFEYPKGVTQIYDCPDIPCASIRQYSLRIEPLRLYGKGAIENDDLYCSADGPTGSTYCLNPEVVSFTNLNNVNGYKILRTRVNETYNPTTQTRDREEFSDRAYVFPITHSEYKAVLFAVDTPTPENLEQLDAIVETFRVSADSGE